MYRKIKESKDKDLFYSKIDELCERATVKEKMELFGSVGKA